MSNTERDFGPSRGAEGVAPQALQNAVSAKVSVWRRPWLADIVTAIVSVGLAVLLGQLLSFAVQLPNMSMIFLAAVLACALLRGKRSAVAAAVLSFVGYDYFFIAPLYTLRVTEAPELFALMIFLIVAVATGSLTGRIRNEAAVTQQRIRQTQSLYEFSRRMSAASSAEEVLWTAAAHVHRLLGVATVLFVRVGDGLEAKAAWPPDLAMDAANLEVAAQALVTGRAVGSQTSRHPSEAMQYRPLRSPRAIVGVCGLQLLARDEAQPDDEDMLTAILDQTAIALDRALLIDEAVKAAALQQNEAVRDALLASLSHDLRTPLATITGSVSSLRELGDLMSEGQRRELLLSIEQESARLSRFVANLLDMSRLESGAMKVRREWVDVSDVIRAAVDRSRKAFPDHPTNISLEPGLPFIRGDATLLEQVLFNLLDNAHKYAGKSGAVVHARREADQVVISVTDEGPGIKAADLSRVFEKFYRGGRNDGRRAGTGLGLSICRGLIDAMGGNIEAQSPAVRRRGTRIVIRLPAADLTQHGA